MSRGIRPRPAGITYRVVITENDDNATREIFNETGEGYVVGVAALTGTRIDALIDHDGPQFLRERLVAYIANEVYPG